MFAKITFSLILGILSNLILNSQVTIILKNAADFPDSVQQQFYVAGNFNGWNPANDEFRLKKENGKLSVTFKPAADIKTLEFKFTLGSWEREEILKDGGYRQNRVYSYQSGMVIEEVVENFRFAARPIASVPLADVYEFKIYSRELDREKNIRVYLPCDYQSDSTGKQYPVLYMFDGQNLFDDITSFSGEWGIDESMDSICSMNNYPAAIIVGIDNAGVERTNEYAPYFIDDKLGGGDGDDLAEFIVTTLKPHVDSTFRTMPDRMNTAIAGSSLGALMSYYMAIEYPEVFSKAGIFSPAFWVNEELFGMTDSFTTALPLRLYFIAGAFEGGEDEVMNDMRRIYHSLLQHKLSNLEMRISIESDGIHNEGFWRSEFMDCYKWLFEN